MKRKTLDINELASKPEWSEVVKLYSGLFDSQEDRDGFITDLLKDDPILAAKCELASTKKSESNISRILKASSGKDRLSIITLIELERIDLVSKRIASITKLKGIINIFIEIINEYSFNLFVDVLLVIKDDYIRNNLFFETLKRVQPTNPIICSTHNEINLVSSFYKHYEGIKNVHYFNNKFSIVYIDSLLLVIKNTNGKKYKAHKSEACRYAIMQFYQMNYPISMLNKHSKRFAKSKYKEYQILHSLIEKYEKQEHF